MRTWGERTWEQLRVSQITAVKQLWQPGFVYRSVIAMVLCHTGPWECLVLYHSTSCHWHCYHQHPLWNSINAESTASATAKPCTVPKKNKRSWGWTGCTSTETSSNWGYSSLWLPRAAVQFEWSLAGCFSPLLSSLSGQLSGARTSLLDSRLFLWPACSQAFPQAPVGSVPCALPVSRHMPLLLCAPSVWTLGETGVSKPFYAPACRFFITG